MTQSTMDPTQSNRFRRMMANEMETAWLYDRLADASGNEHAAETLHELAGEERRHARHWAALLGDVSLAGGDVRPSMQTRAVALLARVVGISAILPRMRAEELVDIRRYEREPSAGHLAQEEREHRAVLGRLNSGQMTESGEHGFASAAAASTFRAALFGFNDGLVSNLSLVAGVAGAAIDSNAVLIAGLAGWLAGAFSMAAGEYVSVRSQAELFENQIAHERLELELDPEEERRELEAIYRRKGVSPEAVTGVVMELMADPETALDTLAREELGLDPDNLGSPWRAAGRIVLGVLAGGDRAGVAVHFRHRV